MTVEDNIADHNRQSYIVGVTEMGWLITHNARHIHITPTEQHLRKQIMKGTECLEEKFTDKKSIEHNKVFKPYRAGTGTCVNTHTNTHTQSDKQEEKCQTRR